MFIILIIELREYTRIIFLIRSAAWSFGITKVGVLDQAGDSRPETPIVLPSACHARHCKKVCQKNPLLLFFNFQKKNS